MPPSTEALLDKDSAFWKLYRARMTEAVEEPFTLIMARGATAAIKLVRPAARRRKDWDEDAHPRDDHGRFDYADGGGGGFPASGYDRQREVKLFMQHHIDAAMASNEAVGRGYTVLHSVYFGAHQSFTSNRIYRGKLTGNAVHDQEQMDAHLTEWAIENAATPLERDVEVYRGMGMTDAAAAGLVPGAVITDKGITSTTFDRDRAGMFPVLGNHEVKVEMKIGLPKGTLAAVNSNEQEVALPRGSEFEVTKVEVVSSGPWMGIQGAQRVTEIRASARFVGRVAVEPIASPVVPAGAKANIPAPPPEDEARFVWTPGDVQISPPSRRKAQKADFPAPEPETPVNLTAREITRIAREAMDGYIPTFIDGITETTYNAIRKAVQQAQAEGTGLAGVVERIRPLFSPERAKRIAVTETTRLVGLGAQAAYRALGIEEWQWKTVHDDRVCDVPGDSGESCEELDEQVFPISEPFTPNHVACRCIAAPVEAEKALPTLMAGVLLRKLKEWDEDLHPRDDHGRFDYADGGGGGNGGGGGGGSGPERVHEAAARIHEALPNTYININSNTGPRFSETLATHVERFAKENPTTAQKILRIQTEKLPAGHFATTRTGMTATGAHGAHISFNEDYVTDDARTERALAESNGIGWLATGSVDGLIEHELGHVVSDMNGGLARGFNAEGVSQYAQVDSDEGFAEAYSVEMTGGELPAEVERDMQYLLSIATKAPSLVTEGRQLCDGRLVPQEILDRIFKPSTTKEWAAKPRTPRRRLRGSAQSAPTRWGEILAGPAAKEWNEDLLPTLMAGALLRKLKYNENHDELGRGMTEEQAVAAVRAWQEALARATGLTTKEWNEEDHPRDEHGRFESAGGGGGGGGDRGDSIARANAAVARMHEALPRTNINMGTVGPVFAETLASHVEKLAEEHPSIASRLTGLSTTFEMPPGVFAQSRSMLGRGEVRFNGDYVWDDDRIGMALAQSYATGWLATGSMDGLIEHEFGHLVAESPVGEESLAAGFDADHISDYAVQGGEDEGFAEAYSALMTGEAQLPVSVERDLQSRLALVSKALPPLRAMRDLCDGHLVPQEILDRVYPNAKKEWNEEDHPRDEQGRFEGDGSFPVHGPISDRVRANTDKWLGEHGLSREALDANARERWGQVTDAQMEKGLRWYSDAHAEAERLGNAHDLTTEQGAGVIAALSPRTEWGANQENAERILTAMDEHDPFSITQEELGQRLDADRAIIENEAAHAEAMGQSFDREGALAEAEARYEALSQYTEPTPIDQVPASVLARTLDAGTATYDNAEKAIRIAQGEKPSDVLGGDKVRSFANNILNPGTSNEVTIDNHMMRVLAGDAAFSEKDASAVFKSDGKYDAFSEPVRAIAKDTGLQPSQVQAVLWVNQTETLARSDRAALTRALTAAAKELSWDEEQAVFDLLRDMVWRGYSPREAARLIAESYVVTGE